MQLLQKELKTINTRNAGSKKRKYIRKEKKRGRGVVVGFLPPTIPHLDSKKLQKGWMGCCGWGKKGGGSYPLALKKCFQFYAVYCCWDIDKSNEKFFDEKVEHLIFLPIIIFSEFKIIIICFWGRGILGDL